jgi:hypothetical protein
MAQKRFAPPAAVPRHAADFRSDSPFGGPTTSPDNSEIIGWEVFIAYGNPTTIFAPVIRYQGEPLHASNCAHCFYCGTWIQSSGSVHHSRQHLTTHPPRREGPGDRSPDIVQGSCQLFFSRSEPMTLLDFFQETPVSASIPTEGLLRQVTKVLR